MAKTTTVPIYMAAVCTRSSPSSNRKRQLSNDSVCSGAPKTQLPDVPANDGESRTYTVTYVCTKRFTYVRTHPSTYPPRSRFSYLSLALASIARKDKNIRLAIAHPRKTRTARIAGRSREPISKRQRLIIRQRILGYGPARATVTVTYSGELR
jgi:hypothetical protein